MEFIVRQLSSRPDTVLVRYDCSCGCKPGVEYRQGSREAGHEQCCCGNVHFVGPGAREQLETHLRERQAPSAIPVEETTARAPWGETIPVAYTIGETGHMHSS